MDRMGLVRTTAINTNQHQQTLIITVALINTTIAILNIIVASITILTTINTTVAMVTVAYVIGVIAIYTVTTAIAV